MMNFRVAPILPTSFGSHGDLPVLTKRTIWYLLQSPPLSLQAFSKQQADFVEDRTMITVSCAASYILTPSTISNDEQHKYYQMQINNDEQTGSITWYDIVEEQISNSAVFSDKWLTSIPAEHANQWLWDQRC